MTLRQSTRGSLTAWEDTFGVAEIVAGSADDVRHYVLTKAPRWQVLGSPDQPDRIFIAADPGVPLHNLAALMRNGVMLLPEGATWEDIGIDGIDLFTSDSDNLVLALA